MHEILKIILILLALMIAACGTSEEDDGDTNPNQDAPYFDTLGNQSVLTGETLNFTVVAHDPNGGNITLSADGTIGPNSNPFSAGANFNASNGNFTWNTDASDAGTYSVRFTAENDSMPALSSNLNVTITVQAPGAPTISNVSTVQNVTVGGTVSFTVIATDPSGFNVTLSADGTVGPNSDPFIAGATFDETTGSFVWNTDAMDVGSYNVQFTATNDAVPPLDSSVNVTINVSDPNGETLYNSYCRSCHGSEGVGGSRTAVQCSLEISIREALGLVQGVDAASGMGGIASNLTDADIAAIAYYLQNVQPQNC